ncbi:hypothetical protein [Clostridium sp. LIBA-8841]|uniref:hypothetical protein n=1 Tax=Clostridium sp. LIBA-8841 TaxID=2987530 RepID=UPI002AC75E7E|nr:hypothetical protein [Clostridium sp. LIBA-8841]MDZ5255195.1 hypothetical protein [Clostridium sp. LIBA-8841]
MVHVVYCDDKEKVLEKIIEGTKTMIIRGAAGRKIPHSRVFKGEDLYFMKKGSKKICAKASIINVKNYVKLSQDDSLNVIQENQDKLNLSEKQMKRWNKKCLCLVEFNNLEKIEPLDFEHQNNMDDWLIVEKIEDVLLGSSVDYNYESTKLK